jgi:hypothetical protein
MVLAEAAGCWELGVRWRSPCLLGTVLGFFVFTVARELVALAREAAAAQAVSVRRAAFMFHRCPVGLSDGAPPRTRATAPLVA